MKTIFLMVILVVAGLKAMPQDNSGQLPIETQFTNGLIVFTLPSPYSSPSFRPMAIPRFVTTLRTMKVHPNTLSKDELIAELKKRLSVTIDEANQTESLDYLKNIALFIYISNNNTSNIPQQSRTALDEWNKSNVSFKEELKLVAEYLKMADGMKSP